MLDCILVKATMAFVGGACSIVLPMAWLPLELVPCQGLAQINIPATGNTNAVLPVLCCLTMVTF